MREVRTFMVDAYRVVIFDLEGSWAHARYFVEIDGREMRTPYNRRRMFPNDLAADTAAREHVAALVQKSADARN